MLRLFLCFALVAAPAASFAQAAPPADAPAAKCLLGGKTFSPGATIRASASVNVCTPEGTWGPTTSQASGCFFADAFYSVGATAAVSGNKSMLAVCGPDGSWSSVPAPANGG